MSLFFLPRSFVVDGTGAPRSGAKLNFYQAGTLTDQDTYADVDLTTPNTNPVVANAAGVFGPIYLANASYRVILTDADDVTIYDQDDVNTQALRFGDEVRVETGNYTVTTTDRGSTIKVTVTATLTLPALSVTGEGFPLVVINGGSGAVTIDGAGSDTIDGDNTLVLEKDEWCFLNTDGNEWQATRTSTSGSFTGTLTGFASPPTETMHYRVAGNIATITGSASVSGTSNANSMTMTGLPAAISPANEIKVPCMLQDNGSDVLGVAEINASAQTIVFWMGSSLSTSGFTSSGTKGLRVGATIVYPLR